MRKTIMLLTEPISEMSIYSSDFITFRSSQIQSELKQVAQKVKNTWDKNHSDEDQRCDYR